MRNIRPINHGVKAGVQAQASSSTYSRKGKLDLGSSLLKAGMALTRKVKYDLGKLGLERDGFVCVRFCCISIDIGSVKRSSPLEDEERG
jgi:hypothetical protein